MNDDKHILGRQHFEPKPGHGTSRILPPLPEPSALVVHSPTGVRIHGYTGDDMRAYARLAIAMRDDNEADEMLAAFEHGKKMARDHEAKIALPYLRTLAGFGGTLDQARALAARAVSEVEAALLLEVAP